MKFSATGALALGMVSVVSATTPPDGFIKNHHIPFDLNGSNFTYPWPVKLYQFLTQKDQTLEMAFMDVAPTGTPNGKTAVLLHGKNFCGATWNGTAIELAEAGYRVILPDQIGFCKSSKPDRYQFSLDQFALNTKALLQKIGVEKATIIGHSMGGMLATRFALAYPANVTELVLVNPIGLEDYRGLGVPYIHTDVTWAQEKSSNYASIRGYEQQVYYQGQWAPEYDIWVRMLENIYKGSRADRFAWNQALIVDMVLTQPIAHDLPKVKSKTLLLFGTQDTTAIGKQWSPPDVAAKLGDWKKLGKETKKAIKGSTLVEFNDLGHAPQIQAPAKFHAALLKWLKEQK